MAPYSATRRWSCLSNADASPQMRQEVKNRQLRFREDVKSRLEAEVRANPEILKSPIEMEKALNRIEGEVLSKPNTRSSTAPRAASASKEALVTTCLCRPSPSAPGFRTSVV